MMEFTAAPALIVNSVVRFAFTIDTHTEYVDYDIETQEVEYVPQH